MTLFAPSPVFATVTIVDLVTGITGGWELLVFRERLGMAGVATQTFVLSLQRVFRLSLVIEEPESPSVGRVTIVAILAEHSFVNILFIVAGKAT